MRTGLWVVLCGCGAVSGWSWTAGSDLALGALDGAGPQAAAAGPAFVQPLAVELLRVAEPRFAEPDATGPVAPIVIDAESPASLAPSPADAERIARRYYHAQVTVEELESLLPGDGDVVAELRTHDRFSGLFVAINERDRLGADLHNLQPPAATERLPDLDLFAGGAEFERTYGNWPREDLLVEHWRLERFAYAQSRRLLDAQLNLGPYSVDGNPPAFAFG